MPFPGSPVNKHIPPSLHFPVIGADIHIFTVRHPEAAPDRPELRKSEPFIQMPRMNIAFYNGIELHNPKSEPLSLQKTVGHQLFADMPAAAV